MCPTAGRALGPRARQGQQLCGPQRDSLSGAFGEEALVQQLRPLRGQTARESPGARDPSAAPAPRRPSHPDAHLALQRHVVHLRVQQHGAGAEWHRLVRDGPRRPAVNPQDLLFAGDDQLLLEERGW